jgi:hypothetical protein
VHDACSKPPIERHAEAFVKTIKRDYVRVSATPDAAGVLRQLDAWFEHHNSVHPHKALGYRSPSPPGQGSQALLTMLYRATDRLCRGGAAVENLAHSGSFHAGEKNAPSKPGTKQLATTRCMDKLSDFPGSNILVERQQYGFYIARQ